MAGTLETILNIRVDGTDSMVKFKTAIDKTTQELKELKAQQKAAGSEGAKFNKEIVQTEIKLKGLKKSLNTAKTDTLKLNTAVSTTGKSYNDLTKKNAALSVQLRKLSDPLGKNKAQFQKLSGEMDKNTNSLKKMDAAMGRQQRNVGNYGAAMAGMAMKLGMAVMAFKTLERVISTFTDFQFAIKQVGVISGATAAEMKMLSDQAKELGSSTAFTAGEVAGLQIELAKLGFNPEDINAMTDSVLDLSYAFGEDLSTTATQVGVTLRGFNLDASEATRVADVMASAFANSALDLTKFSVAMPKVASLAKTMGFTLEDTTSILGLLANTGMEASIAGTSLKNIFLKLADPTGDLAVALGRNVNSVEELIPALQELEAKGIDVAGMLEITDKRSVTAFASLLNGSKKLETLNKVIKNSEGTTKKFADVMRDSLSGSIDETKSAAEGFIIELVEGLEPVLTLLIQGFTGLMNALSYLAPVIITVTSGIVGYYTAVKVGTLYTTLLTYAQGLFGTVTLTMAGAITIAKNAMKALNLAIKANPIGFLVGALTAAIALFSQWDDEADEMNAALKETNEQLEQMNEFKKGLKKQQASEITQVANLITKIKSVTTSEGERLKAINALNKVAGTTLTNLKDEKKMTEELSKAYKSAVDNIKAKMVTQMANKEVEALMLKELELEDKLLIAIANENYAKKQRNDIAEENASYAEADGKQMDQNTQYLNAEGEAVQRVSNIKQRESNRRKSNKSYEDEYLRTQKVTLKLQEDINKVHSEGAAILQKSTDKVNGMVKSTDDLTGGGGKAKTAYEKLTFAVSQATKGLQNAIITNGDVTKATEDLKVAKQNLAVVDTKVAKIIKENDDALKNSNQGLIDKIAKANESIALEQEQLANMKLLSDAGAKLAREQIKQALDVAQAQLDLYLMQISMSTESAEVQAKNINDIKKAIGGFQGQLKTWDEENAVTSPKGWLNSNLFGKGEDGEGFTGQDMVDSIVVTLGAVMDTMAGFNEMQNAQLDEQLNNLTIEKNAEIKKLKATEKWKNASVEDQADMELKITKKFDGDMLKLKQIQFEKDQKFQKSMAIMSGAMAIMQIWSSSATGNAIADAIIKGILTAAMIGMTAMQISTISSAPPPAEHGAILDDSFFANGGMVNGPSHKDGGVKFNVGGKVAELEGGEAVINKRSTAMFRPQLSAMNVAGGGKKFADGGLTFATDILQDQSLAMAAALTDQGDQQVIMVEADVTSSQRSVENIEASVTF